MAGGRVVYGSGIVLFALITVASGNQYHHDGQNLIACPKGDTKEDYR